MKKLLYTLFFGYLELKWRRLVRTLLLSYIILATLFLGDLLKWIEGDLWENYDDILHITFTLIILTPLVSYILKPFVVKED